MHKDVVAQGICNQTDLLAGLSHSANSHHVAFSKSYTCALVAFSSRSRLPVTPSLPWSYLKRPPQCWHWSPTQPGSQRQLPVAALHFPLMQCFSHSFASARDGSCTRTARAANEKSVRDTDKQPLG